MQAIMKKSTASISCMECLILSGVLLQSLAARLAHNDMNLSRGSGRMVLDISSLATMWCILFTYLVCIYLIVYVDSE
ncbi:hypothetical protein F5Y18DRAFT_151421 [Xylariaceae sp. FL1019]|nr:hypothetical protein F5Y18DRAFT_151421 [Xylariaceae sp. FL1019]